VYDTQEGVVNFDGTGALISSTLDTIDNNGTPLKINLGEGSDGIISMDAPVSYSSAADGKMGGDLTGYTIDNDGDIIASFSNGEQSSIGKLAVYHFQNDQGLARVNSSRFEQSDNSGDALFYKDANGNNVTGTTISNFALESSNVDMTAGLTELIILQRSYDANSKSVTTADEMIQKALEMDA
jgi:flagellar hook protein FlgE